MPIQGTKWSTTDFGTGAGYNAPVLTNNNLTCACNTANNNSTVPVSVDGYAAGKYYVEFLPVAGVSRAMAVGIIQNSQARTIAPGATLNTTGCAMVTNGGTITINNVNVGAIAAMVNGTVNGMAVDLGGKLIWFRAGAAGNWNNSAPANPATGVGGLSIASMSGVMKLLGFECTFSAPPVTVTLNAGSSAFVGAVPSGFTAGFPSAAGTDGFLFNTLF